MDFKLKNEQRTVLRTGLYWGIDCTGGWPVVGLACSGDSSTLELAFTEKWHELAGIASTPPKSWGRVWQFVVWKVKRGFKIFRIQGNLLICGGLNFPGEFKGKALS